MNKQCVICICGLQNDKEKVLSASTKDPDLIAFVTEYRKTLDRKKVEIFLQKDNILVAEDGYYIALYASEFKKIADEK